MGLNQQSQSQDLASSSPIPLAFEEEVLVFCGKMAVFCSSLGKTQDFQNLVK